MRRPFWKRPVWLALGGVALLLAGYVLYILQVAGQFKTIEPHFAGTCTAVTGVVGAEDLTIHPHSGIAFLAAVDRRAASNGAPIAGAVWAYDLQAPAPAPAKLTGELPFAFHPHGLSLHVGSGTDTLMVVNHRAGGGVFAAVDDAIEIFAWSGGILTHRETVTDPSVQAINDVVAIDHRRFYATRDHGYASGLMRTVEDYGRLALGSVVYFDGATVRTVAEGFRYTNGINLSLDGTRLYVAATTDGAVSVFRRDPATGDLSDRIDVPLGTGVDNIDVDAEGALWVGAHPRLFDFLAHVDDAAKLSPSQVLKLTPGPDGGFTTTEIYLNAGEELSASSVAARWNDRLLVGPVFDPKFLDCRLP